MLKTIKIEMTAAQLAAFQDDCRINLCKERYEVNGIDLLPVYRQILNELTGMSGPTPEAVVKMNPEFILALKTVPTQMPYYDNLK